MVEYFSAFAFIFGTLIGSFLNVVILRLPAGRDFVRARSACPRCHTQLRWFHNIPIISFLFLRGRCFSCKGKISWRYPLIELLTGLISIWLFPHDLSIESLSNFLFYFSIASVFICHFMIDLDHQLLLDSLNIYLLIIFLAQALQRTSWNFWFIGGCIGFGVPLLVTWIFYKLRGQVGLGGGDIKLFGVLGIFLGPLGIVFNIFLSCLLGAFLGLGLIFAKKLSRDKPMAFGPSILLVAGFQIFFPEEAQILQSWFFLP